MTTTRPVSVCVQCAMWRRLEAVAKHFDYDLIGAVRCDPLHLSLYSTGSDRFKEKEVNITAFIFVVIYKCSQYSILALIVMIVILFSAALTLCLSLSRVVVELCCVFYSVVYMYLGGMLCRVGLRCAEPHSQHHSFLLLWSTPSSSLFKIYITLVYFAQN